jgi:hypothetical protein
VAGPLADDEPKLLAALGAMEIHLDDEQMEELKAALPAADPDKIAAAVKLSLSTVLLGVIKNGEPNG